MVMRDCRLPQNVNENLDLLGFCAAYIGKLTLEDGPISCPETSVTNYQCTFRKIPEMRRFRNNGRSS